MKQKHHKITNHHSDGAQPEDHSRRAFFGCAATAASGALILPSLLAPGNAQAAAPTCPAGGSVAWTQPDNNNGVIAQQQQGESDPMADGEVTLDYFGHCAFRLTSPRGVTVMFDPWRNDPSGYWGVWYPKEFPKTKVDIGLSTHAHFDHDAVDRLDALMLLDRMAGEYRFSDVKITGIADKHACSAPGWYQWTDAIKEFGQSPCPPNNPHHMDMIMYLVETGGMRIAMWGDNRHNPSPSALAMLGDIDVLTLPVDGSQHILSYAQGDALVRQLKPKVVIPTHYLCEGVSITLTTLQTADEWVNMQKNKTMLQSSTLKLNRGELAKMKGEFMYFGANAAIPA